jgi:hypothetical protein
VSKVQHKPIKSPSKGSNKRSKIQPKAALVWRTGLSGVPPDSVRCTRVDQLQLASFGFSGSHSAIIHRLSGVAQDCPVCQAEQRLPTQQSSSTVGSQRYSAWTARAEVRAGADGTPDIEQDLSGAPPDCPVAHMSEAWEHLEGGWIGDPVKLELNATKTWLSVSTVIPSG